jgi:uncharacterized protein DUF4365
MERPHNHITDTLGEAQIRAILEPEPLGWVVNKIESDYGIDFDVQIFQDHRATGEWFKVQLKSSEATNYSANGDFISETLELKNAAHYSTELLEPSFLIHADVQAKRTFWYAPQLDAPIFKDDPRATITIRVETRNELPATLPDMLEALRRIRLKLGAKAVCESHVSDLAKIFDQNNQAELIRKFQDRIDYLKLQEIHVLAAPQGKFDEAREKVERLIANGESSIETRFSAILAAERIDLIASHKDGAPQITASQIQLRTSERLQRLTKNGPPALKFYALIARKAAELDELVRRDFGLYMNWVSHVREGDPAIAVQLSVARLQSTHLLVKKYNQCIRLARLASHSPHRWAVPLALLRVVQSMGLFILRLRIEGQTDTEKSYVASAVQLCRLVVWIAERNRDDDALSAATTAVLTLSDRLKNDERGNEFIDFAWETLAKIGDQAQANTTREAIERGITRLRGERVEDDPEPDLIKQIFENRASGLGIDMTSPDDFLAKRVRLGIKDYSPERAIRHCEHAYVTIKGDIPWVYYVSQMLQLPSMLGKRIHCDLHDLAVAAPTLDGALELFKAKHCDGCKDVAPRPPTWKCTDEWQEQENERHREFLKKFYEKRGLK